MSRLSDVIARLEAVIESRKGGDPTSSWTAKLLADPTLAAKKLGEESIEAVMAASAGDTDNLTAEAADVLYHLLALLAAAGVSTDAVAAQLESREGTSGIAEKSARRSGGDKT
ncbi:MAG: phosphoribosyl-ATP diphosphatase [Caulobacter sp.]|nr:phosphoribosyl-ATP diphosphatase [Caulobacter sp.]